MVVSKLASLIFGMLLLALHTLENASIEWKDLHFSLLYIKYVESQPLKA